MLLFFVFERFNNRNKDKCSRNENHDDKRTVNAWGRSEDYKTKGCPEQGQDDTLSFGKWFSHSV